MKRDKIDRRGVRETQDQDVRPEGPGGGVENPSWKGPVREQLLQEERGL